MIHKERRITEEHTVEVCTSCGAAERRKYVSGDVLFGMSEKCASCGGVVRIEKIYGNTITY